MRAAGPRPILRFSYGGRPYTLQRGQRVPLVYFAFAGAYGLVATGLTAVSQRQPGLRQKLLDCSGADRFRELLRVEIMADAADHYAASPLLFGLVEHSVESLSTRTLRGLVRAAGAPRRRGHGADLLIVGPGVFGDEMICGLLDDLIVPRVVDQLLREMAAGPDPEAGNWPLDTVIH